MLIVKHYIYAKKCLKEKLCLIDVVNVISKYQKLEEIIAIRQRKYKCFQKKCAIYGKV